MMDEQARVIIVEASLHVREDFLEAYCTLRDDLAQMPAWKRFWAFRKRWRLARMSREEGRVLLDLVTDAATQVQGQIGPMVDARAPDLGRRLAMAQWN